MAVTEVERRGRTAVVRLRGDVAITTARSIYGELRALSRRSDVDHVVLDFAASERLDSAGVAIVGVVRRSLEHAGKRFDIVRLDAARTATFALAPLHVTPAPAGESPATWLEGIGERTLATLAAVRSLVALLGEVIRHAAAVVTRRHRLPAGSIATQVLLMGSDAVFIVGLLSFLLGLTIAFQGAVQLDKFGAGVFVADMVSWSTVREFAPLMTAVVLSGRTGAAIAAELGAMRVNQEVDALVAMGVSPVRFLLVPRLAALTVIGPALTLMSTFIGVAGGLVVAVLVQQTAPATFWSHIVNRVELADFMQGFAKSVVFAWIIGLTGCHLGLRAQRDAGSVGRAATRTVVVSLFFIIVVDALFATVIALRQRG